MADSDVPKSFDIPALFDAYLSTIPPHSLFSYIITPPSERIPITLSSAKWTSIPFLLLLFMAYLARRPGTWALRLAIAPVAFIATIRTAFGYQWMDPRFNAYNFGSGLAGVFAATKVIEYAYRPNGILKVGEREPGLIENPAIDIDTLKREVGHVDANGHATVDGTGDAIVASQIHIRRDHGVTAEEKAHEHSSSRNPILAGLSDGLELLGTMRGIGWQFGSGTDLYVARDWRNTTSRLVFALQTTASLLWYFVTFDVVTCGIQMVPGLGTPAGGSIFVFGGEPENLVRKYGIAMVIEFFTGLAFILGFEMVYQLVTLFAILVLQHHPTSWPPLFDRPWSSVSLHEFWSKRWHQLLRQTFLIMGGYPLASILSSSSPPRLRRTAKLAGFVFGTFTASGLFHYWALYAMGRGTDVRCLYFFMAQSVGIGLERVWKGVSGKRVGGWAGTVWVWIWVVGGIQWCINAWHERGFAGGMLVPPEFSPARHFVLPFANHLLELVGVDGRLKT